MVLDGYGLNDRTEGNAIAMANTPVMDKLMKECPFQKGYASGLAVGLPDGQMGNSEVGHMNIGAGRIIYQDLTRITKDIEDGTFFKNEELLEAMENCKKNDSDLHLFGLLSDGGVHSHLSHVYGLLEMAKQSRECLRYMFMRSSTEEIHLQLQLRDLLRHLRIRWQKSELVRSHLYQAVTMQWTEIITGTE